MRYNFDEINDRSNTNSLKWDIKPNEFPMWVADMDFKTAPAITEAIQKRAATGIYGYNTIPDTWRSAITGWWQRRHHFQMNKDWLIFCTGVVPAITCAVKRMTNVGDFVLVQTPVYNAFFNSIENHGRHVLENELLYDGKSYRINFEDLEEKLSHPLTTMMILCNPQNPVGTIWSREELEKIGILCARYHVTVVADEIHCDITEPGKEYIPFASVSDVCRDNSITCISATKAFNIAGIQTAAVVIPSEKIFQKMERGLNSEEVAEPNTFAIDTVIAAFTEGADWLDELCTYFSENKKVVTNYIEKNIPDLKVVPSDATYLLWIDAGKLSQDAEELCTFLRKKTGLYLLSGNHYRGNADQFIRMNIACPKSQVEAAMEMLKEGIEAYRQQNRKDAEK
ncbi:MAG: pyridoxal phosphate-dependent aminotransferase [Hespellia sp.]|nr:pyridoxal phosphate-dependent aminotransferase [Hespellia sp.]